MFPLHAKGPRTHRSILQRPRGAATALAIVLGGLAAVPAPAAAQAAGRPGGITHIVHFSVPPIVRLRIVRQPELLRVTARDVAAGFVELEHEVEVEILTNLRGGYALHFGLAGPVARAAEVTGLRSPVRVGRSIAAVDFPDGSHKPGRRTLQLGLRLELAAGVVPGAYPWPVSMAVARA
jgi:hypothetical protein